MTNGHEILHIKVKLSEFYCNNDSPYLVFIFIPIEWCTNLQNVLCKNFRVFHRCSHMQIQKLKFGQQNNDEGSINLAGANKKATLKGKKIIIKTFAKLYQQSVYCHSSI